MKKILVIAVMVALCGAAFAQRPVGAKKSVQKVGGNTAIQTNRTAASSDVRAAGAGVAASHTYTVSPISVPNITVIDYNVNVTPQNKQNKLKVDVAENVNGISYCIFDANGQMIDKNWFKGTTGYIDMSSLPVGEFSIYFEDNKGAQRHYKIVKR